MPIVHAIVLGVTQGLSEFLPVSSSGHLILVPWLFGWEDFAGRDDLAKAFDVALHIGTLVGAVAYFRADVARLVGRGLAVAGRWVRGRPVDDPQGRTAWLLVLATVPAAVTGATLDSALSRLDDEIWLVAVLLVVFGGVLAVADRLGGDRDAGDFNARDALSMGMGQALALQPGVSRSGVTITVARAMGFTRDAAARLSFLMSIPVIAGAGAYKALDVAVAGGIPAGMVPAFAVGVATSAVTGWVAVWGTLRLVRTRTFDPFVVYRVVVGCAVLALLASPWR